MMPARSAVLYAKSGCAADLQAAINRARTGDTISIPAGRYSFKGTVNAPDGIYIRGAGRDKTFLIKSDNTSVPMIVVDATTGKPFKFSDITPQGRLDALQGTNRTVVVTTITDGGLYIRGSGEEFQDFQRSIHEVPARRNRISGRCRVGARRTDGRHLPQ